MDNLFVLIFKLKDQQQSSEANRKKSLFKPLIQSSLEDTAPAGKEPKSGRVELRRKGNKILAEPSVLLNSINMQNSNQTPPVQLISALKCMEAQLGPEITKQLILDYSSKLKDPVRKQNANDSVIINEESSVSDTSITSSNSNKDQSPIKVEPVKSSKLQKPFQELDADR